MRVKPENLTPKQLRFVEEHLIDFNGTQAAIRAGYSRKSAAVQASKLLRDPKVRAAIEKRRAEITERVGVETEDIVRELARIGFADMAKFVRFEGGGAVVDLSMATEEETRLIHEITTEVYIEGKGDNAVPVKKTRLKLYSKLDALMQLGRYKGMFDANKGAGVVGEAQPDRVPLEERLKVYQREDQIASATNVVPLSKKGRSKRHRTADDDDSETSEGA